MMLTAREAQESFSLYLQKKFQVVPVNLRRNHAARLSAGYTLISGATAFLVGSIVGLVWGVPGITIGGILGTWIVIFLLRRNEKHDDPSTE